MKELLNSHIKTDVLLYLGLRGAASGRTIAKQIKSSPTPVYKALRQLTEAGVLLQDSSPPLYRLNHGYLYYQELLSMIHKTMQQRKNLPYFPNIPAERRIDVASVYELLPYQARKSVIPIPKLSHILKPYYVTKTP